MPITLTTEGAIARIFLANPAKHNALTAEALALFMDHLDVVSANGAIRALIITNSGGKTFCSGAALQQLASGAMSGELFSTLTDRVAAMAVPTIAAINGNAYGGGAELALSCDFRVGSHGTRVFVPPARIGLCYPLSGMQRFVRRLGLTTAKRLLIAGEEFDGEQLLQHGFLTHLVDAEAVESRAITMASTIAELAPMAVQTMKLLCDEIASGTVVNKTAQKLIDRCNHSDDLREGLAAVAEKRTPVFKGI
ncbi:MAG: enoyl-CoA hydratase/isomerase family protein [Porticoccaceae bacterium]|nr:enoyl-CoA hydratase/isomerase family protein [Porticoccaceae bacterium]